MKKNLFFLTAVIISNVALAQDLSYSPPDYELIKSEINDNSSKFYYPQLLDRLTNFDSTLTNEEYRYLYYGYVFHDNYDPHWTSPDEENLLKYYRSTDLKEEDYDQIIKLATHSIDLFPFDLRAMNYLGFIYHLKGDEKSASKMAFRFQSTIGAILSTGNGETCEAGFHVISIGHEYVILNMFQFQMKSQSLTGDCDYLALEKDQRNVEGIYFNVKQLNDILLSKFKDD